MQVRIAEGAINFRVRELREGDVYEVDTPNLAFTVKQAGAFRVDVSENGDATAITAIRGEGEVTAGGQTYTVHVGDRAEFTGGDDPQYKVTAAPPEPDGLDRWAAERDLREDNSTSVTLRFSRTFPASRILTTTARGTKNRTTVRCGIPTPLPLAGLLTATAIGTGSAPGAGPGLAMSRGALRRYHYGRWSYIGSRWGWCPGLATCAPFYGPAFVGFLGGSRFGVGFGIGGGFGVGLVSARLSRTVLSGLPSQSRIHQQHQHSEHDHSQRECAAFRRRKIQLRVRAQHPCGNA